MMNKFYTISLFFLFLLYVTGVKAESKLIKVTSSDMQMTFSYLPNGMVDRAILTTQDAGPMETTVFTFTYESDRVIENVVETALGDEMHQRRTSVIKDGLITEETLETEEDGMDMVGGVVQYEKQKTYRYKYDTRQRMTEVTAIDNENTEVHYSFTWQGDNITKVTITVNGNYAGYIDYGYYDVSANKHLTMLCCPAVIVCLYGGMVPYGQIQAGHYGVQPVGLLREISFRVNDTYADKLDIAADDISLSYENGADGLVKNIRQMEGAELDVISLEWDVTSGIRHYAERVIDGEASYYDLGGRKLPQCGHGLTIVKGADGKTKKVLNR